MPAPAAVHREAVALRALALALVAVLARIARRALVAALRLLLPAGDERRQPIDIAVVAALVALAALLLRTAAILLLARREELRIARQVRLRIARAERRLLAAALAALHRRRRAL